MPTSSKIPLNDRLRKLGADKPNRYPFFELFIDDVFFDGMTELTGLDYWVHVYTDYIAPYIQDKKDYVFAEVVEKVDFLSLPENKKDTLLYRLLIEPFAYLNISERCETEQ